MLLKLDRNQEERHDHFDDFDTGVGDIDAQGDNRDDDIESPKFVNAYAVTREFGGPEEGGWYYDQYEPLQCVPVASDITDEQVASIEADLRKTFASYDDGRELSSVLSKGRVSIMVESHVATREPATRPHYE